MAPTGILDKLINTKLSRPQPTPELVSRQRLVDILEKGTDRKLVLISAPAGFGKTTLLSEWADVCEKPVAWVALDDGDNDSATFIAYLIAALKSAESTTKENTRINAVSFSTFLFIFVLLISNITYRVNIL